MHSDAALYDQLTATLREINSQIDAVKANAQKYIDGLPYPGETTVYQLRDKNGKYVLTDLLVAKSSTLAAMTNIKAAQKNGRK